MNDKTKPLFCLLALIIPFLGIVFFFAEKEDDQAARTYLAAGIVGFIISFLILLA